MNVLSEESAKEELEKLYEYYEFDPKERDDEEQMEVIESLEKVLIKGIRKGSISFVEDDEKGFCVIQKLKNGTEIEYKEFCGQAKIAMSKKREGDETGKNYALLGVLSGLGENAFHKMKGPDLKRAEHIGGILLLSSAQ